MAGGGCNFGKIKTNLQRTPTLVLTLGRVLVTYLSFRTVVPNQGHLDHDGPPPVPHALEDVLAEDRS